MNQQRYEIRPLVGWTGPVTKHRRPASTFRAAWSDTLDLLGRETLMLGARLVVIQIDVTEGEIRRDGMLRANARVSTPGVKVAFESKHGPLTYATDEFGHWQANVRAIAEALTALREVDQYGLGVGTQYSGFMPSGARLMATPAGAYAIPLRDRQRRITHYALVDDQDEHLAQKPWYQLASGYVVRTEVRDGRKVMVYLHREVVGVRSSAEDPVQVDHIDGNRLDNRRSNLRVANASENAQNRGANRGRCLPRGVHYRPRLGDYLALGKLHGRRYEVGTYATPEEADRAIRGWRAANMPFSADARRSSAKQGGSL
jgi:hypothetical protein